MFDVPLIHRIFTRDENGTIQMEEAWDTSGRFAEVFGTDDNPYFRRWSYTQKNYDGLKAVFPEHIKNGKLSPEVAARTKWL